MFRLVVVAAAVIGMVYTWIALDSPLNPLVLFTVQSNLLLAGYYFWRVVSRRPASAEVKGAVTLYIVITGLVWHFLRMGGASPFERLSLSGLGLGNFLLHYVTPVMAVIDWLVFDRIAPRPRWVAALLWLVYPVAYMVFALVRGVLLPAGAWKRYPYPFLDVDRFGYGGVALMALALAVCFALLGCGLIALHRLVKRASRT
ncbi:Pr6Pr family membrane protein [Acrocarpospora macrocephala]|uniref:Integral membrane regulator n=1 Tax=Acrocarpospora macrocephala TaxID=150177 RepID=A0A5M3WRU8_9ACTN|nr:Pr6Pr family membrane protein [Acrocarpospora macrocephala]GES11226.1 integral membrane regulator [Acrocarpospora macrocephala]